MRKPLRKPSPAMVVACLALFVASTGTSIAASHYLITSTKQIKPSVLAKLKGAKGPSGATGTAGTTGAQGPSGIVTTAVFNGGSITIPGSSGTYLFVGATATVTTAGSQRLTGAAEVPLQSTASGSGQSFDYGLCFQSSTGGAIYDFVGGDTYYSSSRVYPEYRTFAATASTEPGAGTWKVGFCIRNGNLNSIHSDYVNGWVQVTN